MLCCHGNSLHSIFTRSRVYFKKPLSLLIHKKELLICSSFIMRLKQFSHICQATLLLFWSFYHIYSYFLHQSFEPLKVVCKGWIHFFQTLVTVGIWISSHESCVFLMASRRMDPFQKTQLTVIRLIRGVTVSGSVGLWKWIWLLDP